MSPCNQNSKKTCMNCKHYEYCDRANLCNGKFEKVWQFSSCLIKKGFDILEVSKSENFTDGNIPRTQESDKILLRACQKGEPVRKGSRIEVSGKFYEV